MSPSLSDGLACVAVTCREPLAAPETGGRCLQVPQNVAQAHEKAQAAAALRAASEASIAPGKPADHDLLAAFRAYIMLEKRAGDPARVQVRPCRCLLSDNMHAGRCVWSGNVHAVRAATQLSGNVHAGNVHAVGVFGGTTCTQATHGCARCWDCMQKVHPC